MAVLPNRRGTYCPPNPSGNVPLREDRRLPPCGCHCLHSMDPVVGLLPSAVSARGIGAGSGHRLEVSRVVLTSSQQVLRRAAYGSRARSGALHRTSFTARCGANNVSDAYVIPKPSWPCSCLHSGYVLHCSSWRSKYGEVMMAATSPSSLSHAGVDSSFAWSVSVLFVPFHFIERRRCRFT